MIPLNEQFKISFNFMTFILIMEGILFMIEYYKLGFTQKALMYMLFMILTKLSQINTILYYNRLEK